MIKNSDSTHSVVSEETGNVYWREEQKINEGFEQWFEKHRQWTEQHDRHIELCAFFAGVKFQKNRAA